MVGVSRLAFGALFLVSLQQASAREIEQAFAAEPTAREICVVRIDDPLPAARQVAACTSFLSLNDASPAELATAHLARAHGLAMLGNRQAAATDYLAAIDGFSQLIERTQPNPLHAYRRATAYHALGDADLALADYNTAIERSPRRAIAFLNRGILLARYKGEFRSALADFDEALGIEPANLAGLMLRGEARSVLGDYPGAIADLDKAATLAPGLPQIPVLRGLANARRGEPGAAIADYDRALALDAGNVDALTNRAALRAVAGDNVRAIADLDRVLALQPANAVALYNRGYSHFTLGDHDGAVADYSAALAADPEMAVAYTNRCLARAVAGRDEAGARADCARAASLMPQSADVHETRAFLHLKLGETRAALAEYEAALEIDDTRPIALYGRALARARLGDPAGAANDREAANARFPGVAREFSSYGIQ